MNTPIHTFVPTEQDFIDMQRLHAKRHRWARLASNFLYYGLTALAAFYLVWVAILSFHAGPDVAFKHFVGIGTAAFSVLVLPVAASRRRSELWQRSVPSHLRGQPVTIQFDSEQIVCARPGDSELRVYWKSFAEYSEDDRLALLYLQPKSFLSIPKRAMAPDEWNRLRELARVSIAERKK